MREMFDFYEGMHISRSVREFSECVIEVGLTDLLSRGPLFTWNNKRADGFLAKKLDRAPVNSEWMDIFPNFYVEFTPPKFSGHCAG